MSLIHTPITETERQLALDLWKEFSFNPGSFCKVDMFPLKLNAITTLETLYSMPPQRQAEVVEHLIKSHEYTAESLPPLGSKGLGAGNIFRQLKTAFKFLFDFDTIQAVFSNHDPFVHQREAYSRHHCVIGQVEWRPTNADNNPYTGLFAEGGVGILKLSISTRFGAKIRLPGIGINFFRENLPPLSIVARPPGIDTNEKVPNLFDRSLTLTTYLNPKRHLSERLAVHWFKGWLSIRGIKFNPYQRSLEALAKFSLSGTPVEKPISPIKLSFKPNTDLDIPLNGSTDVRIELGKIEPGATIYTVNAIDPQTSRPIVIGDLVLVSKLKPTGLEEIFVTSHG